VISEYLSSENSKEEINEAMADGENPKLARAMSVATVQVISQHVLLPVVVQ
jgi:hypothetical protein